MGRSNSNIIFRTSNELERVHILVIELEHPFFGFERTNIEPNRAFTKFTRLLIELTRTSFFRTANKFEHVHLLVIELKHPIFAFEHRTSNIVRPITTVSQMLFFENIESNRLIFPSS